jgi:hypothetical protein
MYKSVIVINILYIIPSASIKEFRFNISYS